MTPRLAIAATFAAFGVSAGVWSGASAATVLRVGMSASGFGLALTLTTITYLTTMSGAGAIAGAFGVRRTMLAALLAMGPALGLILVAPSALWLAVAMALQGLLGGLLDATMNAEGARVEQDLGKPVFVQFHASASAATAISAPLGGWLAFGGHAYALIGVAAAALIAAALAVAASIVERPSDAARLKGGPSVKAIDLALAALGVAVGVSIVCETSALAWSALLLRKTAPAFAAYAGLGVAFFAGFQSAVRFQIDRLRRAFDDRTLMLGSYAVATAGLLVIAADRGFAPSAAGFALLGAGTAAIVPCGFSLAARRPGLSAGLAISAVSFFGLFPRAPAPLLTGLIADWASLSTAFMAFAFAMALALAAVAAFVPKAARTFSLAPRGLAE